MFKGLKFNVHCVVYGALALVHAAAAFHLGGEAGAALCDAATAAGYSVLLWLHRGHGPGTGSASRDDAGPADTR